MCYYIWRAFKPTFIGNTITDLVNATFLCGIHPVGVSGKGRLTYRYAWSMLQVLVESELFIYFCYFVCVILVILCSLLCVSVFYFPKFILDDLTWLCIRLVFSNCYSYILIWFLHWTTFFWYPLESWFPWLLFEIR